MEIRALGAGDAEVFWKFRLEALETEPAAFAQSAEEHRSAPFEDFARRVAASSDDNFVLGAFLDGDLVGTAGFARSVRQKEIHKALIWGVYVRAQVRGRGVGRGLLEELVRRARSRPGLEQIALAVGNSQPAAKGLYETLGFRVFGHEERALKNGPDYVDEYHMVLPLTP